MDKPELNEDGTPKETQDPQGVPLDAVKELVDTFKETVKEMKSTPAPQLKSKPSAVSEEDKAAKMRQEFDAVKEQVDEQAAAGSTAEAMLTMYNFITKAGAASAPDLENNPDVLARISLAKRAIRADHKEAFAKYGDEIENVISALPLQERVNPDSWERAIKEVRADHIDEIIEERTKAVLEEQEESPKGTPTTPIAQRARGPRNASETTAADLSTEQLSVNEAAFGWDVERYAKAVDKYGKNLNRDGSVALTEDPPGTEFQIEPGKF